MITIPTEYQVACNNDWNVNPNATLPGNPTGTITTPYGTTVNGCVDATTLSFGNGSWYADSSLASGWNFYMDGSGCSYSGSVPNITIYMTGGPDAACSWGLEAPASASAMDGAGYGLSYEEYKLPNTYPIDTTSSPWAVGAFSSYSLSSCAGTQIPGVWSNGSTWFPGSGSLDQGCLTPNGDASEVIAGVSSASALNIYQCGFTSVLTSYDGTESYVAGYGDVDSSTPFTAEEGHINWSDASNGCVQFGLSTLPSTTYQSTPSNAISLAGDNANVKDDANVEVEVDPTFVSESVTCDGATYSAPSTATCSLDGGDATISAQYNTPAGDPIVLGGNEAELLSDGSSLGPTTSDPASFSVAPPSAAGTVDYNAEALDTYGSYVLATSPTISIDWTAAPTTASYSVSLSASCTSCAYDAAATLSATATVNGSESVPSGDSIVIEETSPGSSVVASGASDPESASVGPYAGSTYDYVAYLENSSGGHLAQSSTVAVTWASAPSTTYSISLGASCISCSYNQASTLSATATVNGSESIPSGDSIVIEETSPSSSTVASTTSSDPESVSVGPYAGSTYDYVAYLENSSGGILAQSSTVAVTWGSAPVSAPPVPEI